VSARGGRRRDCAGSRPGRPTARSHRDTHQVDDALTEEARGQIRRGAGLLPHLLAQVRELALLVFLGGVFARRRWFFGRGGGGVVRATERRRRRRRRRAIARAGSLLREPVLTASTTTAPARRPRAIGRTGAAIASLRAPPAAAPAPAAAGARTRPEDEEEEAPAAPRDPAARPEQPSIASRYWGQSRAKLCDGRGSRATFEGSGGSAAITSGVFA